MHRNRVDWSRWGMVLRSERCTVNAQPNIDHRSGRGSTDSALIASILFQSLPSIRAGTARSRAAHAAGWSGSIAIHVEWREVCFGPRVGRARADSRTVGHDVLEGELMAPHRQSRRSGSDKEITRVAASRRIRRRDRSATETHDEAVALSFLSEILIGDSEWTLSEVRQIVELRDRARFARP